MAHFKVVVGALLACAICVQGFPADSPASSGFGIGSSSFEPNKPLSSFGSTSAPRPLPGSFYPQGTTGFPSSGSTVNRFVRDDSHEQAHGHTATSDSSSSTSAPHRRDATTETIKTKPLLSATTEHTAARRDQSSVLGGATVKPVQLPGSLAASASAASTAAPKSKRADNSQVTGSTSKPFAAVTIPATFNKPTAAPLNKRDQGSQISGSTSKPSSSGSFSSGSVSVKPLSASAVASKIRRDVTKAAATTSKPAATTSSGAKPAVKPLTQATTASSKNKRESTSTSSPVKPVRPLWPSTAEPSPLATQKTSTPSSRNKRQAPLSDDGSDEDDNRQLNRPTLIPRPSGTGRPTRRPILNLINRRTTPSPSDSVQSNSASIATQSRPLAASTQAKPLAATTQASTVTKFKRDQFPSTQTEIYKPFNVEHFAGSETLPGQTTYFTGSSLSSNNPQGGTSGFSSSSVAGTTFSNPSSHLNKRETDGDSSSGEESQEDL